MLTLYDPDRSQTVTSRGADSRLERCHDRHCGEASSQQRDSSGAGLRLLTETIVSPTLGRQIENLLEDYPKAKWHQYEPINDDDAAQRRASWPSAKG